MAFHYFKKKFSTYHHTLILYYSYFRQKLKGVRRNMFLGLIILFFALSGAVIRVFQSMSTTFALCGPLELDAHRY